MPRIERHAEVVWEGNLARGSGLITAGTGAFERLEYSNAVRIGKGDEGKTSPEELLAEAKRIPVIDRTDPPVLTIGVAKPEDKVRLPAPKPKADSGDYANRRLAAPAAPSRRAKPEPVGADLDLDDDIPF